MHPPTIVAHLTCDEATARRLASHLAESLDGDDAVCAAFAGDDGHWHVDIHFRTAPDDAAIEALVANAAGDAVAATLTFTTLAPADWVTASLAGLKPVHAGRFVVHGAHDRVHIAVNRIGIEIEAALAFGTGHHGTTRGCLLALDRLAKRSRPRRILDIGSGSGVLAIGAANRLRRPVLATDIDETAVTSARTNIARNGVAHLVTCRRGNGCRIRAVGENAPYDLIFANILLEPLQRLAAPIAALAAHGGHVVLSGLLPAQAHAALAVYCAHGLRLRQRLVLEGWATLLLRKD